MRVKKQLIMVMGAQRSGTTALFRSLAHDRALTSFHESAEDALYYLYRLRPVREIAPILNAAPGAVLLKPITETLDRSLEELKTEYANYALKFVWIYRDPVNVLHSMSRKGWLPCALEGEPGAGTWVARNQLALRFQKDHPAAIAIVRYEDLVSDPTIFGSLCKSLDVNGAPVFREDRGGGRSDLPLAVQRAIEAATGTTLRALDSVRTFRPGRLQRWKTAARAKLLRPAKRLTSATVSSSPREWKEGVAAAQPTLPADLESLLFWLDAGRLSPQKGRIQQAEESGPLRLRALADGQPPFCIPFLNGQSASILPYEQGDRTTVRRTRCASVRRSRNRKMSARGRFVFSLCPYQTAHSARATPTPRADRRRAHPLRRCKRRVYSRMGPRSSGIAGHSSHQRPIRRCSDGA